MSAKEEKARLREQLKLLRASLPGKDKSSGRIIKHCIDFIKWDGIHSLHAYVSSEKLAEVNTWPLLEHSWQHYPHINTFVPIVIDGKIESVHVNKNTKWQANPWGFLEPQDYKLEPSTTVFDVIVVPALGFDRLGYRIGHGSGHYDKFLAEQKQAKTIGLAYTKAEVEPRLPVEPHDIRLNVIITENGVLKPHTKN